MWIRQELKFRAKKAFKANYWKSVLVGLIMTVVTEGFTFYSTFNITEEQAEAAMNGASIKLSDFLSLTFNNSNPFFAAGFSIFTIAISILLLNPAIVGCDNFYFNNRKDPTTDLKPLGVAFSDNYGNIVKTMFFQDLFIFLWSLLLVIPGIIKLYQYRLVPFILAENPDMDYKDVLERSKELMYGSKMKAFILDLSFIGWAILGGMTLGILLFFFVAPYIYATDAELYMALAHPDESKRVGLAVPDAETVEFEVKKED